MLASVRYQVNWEQANTLAQMAIAWVLRDPRVTSALIGAHSVAQLDDSLKALDNLAFTADELAAIDKHATEGGVDLWRAQSRQL
jgi:L-glyceraldehyde 3-phosphate reductase